MQDEQPEVLSKIEGIAPFFVIESLNKTGPLMPGSSMEGRYMADGARQHCFAVSRSINGLNSIVAVYDGEDGTFRTDTEQFERNQKRIMAFNKKIADAVQPQNSHGIQLISLTKCPGFITPEDLASPTERIIADALDLRDFTGSPHMLAISNHLRQTDNAVIVMASGMFDRDFSKTVLEPLIEIGILPPEAIEWLGEIPLIPD